MKHPVLKQNLFLSYQYLQASKLIELKAQSIPLMASSAGICVFLASEKAPVQEKLLLTLNVPAVARMWPLEKRTSMKVWILACKEVLLQGCCIERDQLRKWCGFLEWLMSSTMMPLHRVINQTGAVICSMGLQVKNRCTCHFFSFLNKENVILAKRCHEVLLLSWEVFSVLSGKALHPQMSSCRSFILLFTN